MGFLSDITDIGKNIIGGITGRTGAEASREAGALQAGAITEASKIAAASQEKGLQALMEQLGLTREAFAPFLAAGTEALPRLQEGATLEGLSGTLSQILGGDLFGDLIGERERGVRGQLAAGGLTRSGTAIEEAARIPTDLAMQIENMLFGRTRDIAGTGLSAAAQAGGAEGGLSAQIANMFQSIGGTQAAGITGPAQATATGILGAAQSQTQGIQNLMNLGVGVLSIPGVVGPSDPRLKKNIQVVGKIGPLDMVTWDWIEEVKDSIVSKFNTIGFLSTQVKEFYPEHVSEFGGYDMINYSALHKELRWH